MCGSGVDSVDSSVGCGLVDFQVIVSNEHIYTHSVAQVGNTHPNARQIFYRIRSCLLGKGQCEELVALQWKN
jgi:hypothetical protein